MRVVIPACLNLIMNMKTLWKLQRVLIAQPGKERMGAERFVL